ncbi:acyltransferase family protein [Actinomycetota bacterium Odt1-20B]
MPQTVLAPPTPGPRSARASPARQRDPFFDNAKFLLVTLVVIGHNWGSLPSGADTVKAAYCVVYLFHMPAFILLCGYFSRGFACRPDQIRTLLARVLAPYLLFTLAYKSLYVVLWDAPFALDPTEPTYLLWFLVALFLWRITSPIWRAVRHPVALAVAVSLAAGLSDVEYTLALPRVLMFLPWFVLGLRLRPEHFRRLRTPLIRTTAVLTVTAAVAASYALSPAHDVRWLHMQYGNDELHAAWPGYLLARTALLVASAVLVAAFFALVPARRTRFTELGTATMFPFLAHGLLVRTGEAYGAYDLLGLLGAGAVLATTLLGTALTWLLSAAPLRRALRPFVEPRFPRRLVPVERT